MGSDAFQARHCCCIGARLQLVEQTPGCRARCLALRRAPWRRGGAVRHPTRTPVRTVVDLTSKAHVGAKYFSPAHPWCVVDLGAHHDLWCDDGGWLGEWISMAHVGAKYFSPVQPWCGGAWRARDHNVWLMEHQRRTDGRKMFRPYIHPSCSGSGARLMGAMGPAFLGSRKLSVSHCAGLLMM